MRDNRGGVAISTSFPMVTPELPAWVEELELRDREYPTQEGGSHAPRGRALAVECGARDRRILRGGGLRTEHEPAGRAGHGLHGLIQLFGSARGDDGDMIAQQAAGAFDEERTF